MKKKNIMIGSIAILLLFVAIMVSGPFLKNPIVGNDHVIDHVNAVESFAKEKIGIKQTLNCKKEFKLGKK
ncbi:hypothetical protein [Tepidibacillus marianensis]|uniref:hypothetical protein n=1 Tax=Tepidibacillus marianensis TaxID=3131995 RepID=UPI0030D58E59